MKKPLLPLLLLLLKRLPLLLPKHLLLLLNRLLQTLLLRPLLLRLNRSRLIASSRRMSNSLIRLFHWHPLHW
jgi:hypothetical protein